MCDAPYIVLLSLLCVFFDGMDVRAVCSVYVDLLICQWPWTSYSPSKLCIAYLAMVKLTRESM